MSEPKPAAAATAVAAPAPAPAATTAPAAPTALAAVSPKRGTTEKMSRLRKVIAARMVESLQVSAQLTSVLEVDVTKIAQVKVGAKATVVPDGSSTPLAATVSYVAAAPTTSSSTSAAACGFGFDGLHQGFGFFAAPLRFEPARRFRQVLAQVPHDQRTDAGNDEHRAPAEGRDD